MQVFTFFLTVEVHWTFPKGCTVGTSLGGTTRGILGGYPGRVLSLPVECINHHICLTRVVMQSEFIIILELYPSALPHVEVPLGENILQTLTV